MRLKDAFNTALDLVRYLDEITISRQGGNSCYITFAHSMIKYGDYDPHRAVIHYREHIGGEDWREINKTSRLYPKDKRLNVRSLIYADPEESGWHFHGFLTSDKRGFENDIKECRDAIRVFEEDLNKFEKGGHDA